MFSIFRNRSFALLWSGQVVSSIGSALTTLGASILVFRLTGSALSVGLMLIATAGPTILIGLIAGAERLVEPESYFEEPKNARDSITSIAKDFPEISIEKDNDTNDPINLKRGFARYM